MKLTKWREYAPRFVRIGVALAFLLLGLDQLVHTDIWEAYFPLSLFGFSSTQLALINGSFDLILGLLLLLGLFVRIISGIMVLHLTGVMIYLGYNEITIRDFSIFLSALAVFLHGADGWSWMKKSKF